jgi:CheY-like chemotaxis protein
VAEVLIVDDDENNRLLLATLLRHAGHTPFEAGAGREGLEIAREKRPALIIVDLSLPDISGVQLLHELRTDARTAKLGIAVYTATQPGAALDELRELYGIGAIIPKPGDPREVLSLLTQLLES